MSDVLWLADQGDGSYRNPVLFCDYADPDAICVGDTYYMTASSFNYVPGLPILTSRDLVNWTLRNYALPNIPDARFDVPRHAQGVWAPALRFHEGRFYIYYGMPDEGIFMTSAADALGAWDAPVCVLAGKGLIDPCPLWDDDGHAWVVHGYAKSRIGFKSMLGAFPMRWDGRRAVGDDHLIYDGRATQPTIEGPKVYKRDGWYYIFAPAGGVPGGWQTVLRSRDIRGPYEERVVLRQGDTMVNGPHQGAWVQTPGGEDWFLHFQSRGLYGRIVHLQPMAWAADGWPRMGMPAGEPGQEACGVPVARHRKPQGPLCAPTSEQASDDFRGKRPGLQWQFMGNWREDFLSVGGGRLTLYARRLPGADTTLWGCPQALTQKVACPAFTAETTVDAASLHAGEQAGMALMGGQYSGVALRPDEQGIRLVRLFSAGMGQEERVLAQARLPQGVARVHLRMTLTPTARDQAEAAFAWSLDGITYIELGAPFAPTKHTWVGVRMALFAMPLACVDAPAGCASFGPFRVTPSADFPFD